MSDERVTLLVHIATGRPACVLLQAAMGGNSRALSRLGFDSRDWITGAAGDPSVSELVRVTGTPEQWSGVVEKLETRRRAARVEETGP